jgi:hypothetical protein
MYQPDRDFADAIKADRQASHRRMNEGIDCSVMYLEPKRVAHMAGVSHDVVRYALNKNPDEEGYLHSIRRGRGIRVLIHPLDARQWILDRATKEEQEKVAC